MTNLLTKKSAVEVVLEYILQHEHEDFQENPSDNHVYYSALVAKYGAKYANVELEAAKNQESGLICQDCCKVKESTRDTICPFANEIHEEQICIRVCDDCYHEREMDI